jgi:hypothetical protein
MQADFNTKNAPEIDLGTHANTSAISGSLPEIDRR